MKIRSLKLTQFKRFAELTVTDLPSTARLVVLAGPNGCGKSSLFDALHTYARAMSQRGTSWDVSYYQRSSEVQLGWSQCITVTLDREIKHADLETKQKLFYFRSAYRNDPQFNLNALSRLGSVTSESRFSRMIETDAAVTSNYSRLASQALEDVFALEDEDTTLRSFRERVIADIRNATARLFPGLILNGIGNPLEDGTFRFDKGDSKRFSYMNLSGGEKAAFDLLLDLVVKRRAYDDTVYCIDEPEAHISTRVQGQLLEELVALLPQQGQLWIATHSIGMMRKARDMYEADPGSVVFLDFGDRDFDAPVVITPEKPTRAFWERVLNVALDDLALLVAPQLVVLCEGSAASAQRGKNADHDARCYSVIFEKEFPEVRFISGGNSHEVSTDRVGASVLLPAVVPGIRTRRLVDRDDHSDADVARIEATGAAVLSRRHLESYLYDDEVLRSLCRSLGKPECADAALQQKAAALTASVARGNPQDDVKSAAGELHVALKRLLSLTRAGNDARAFQRETLAPLVVPGTAVYEELKACVFP